MFLSLILWRRWWRRGRWRTNRKRMEMFKKKIKIHLRENSGEIISIPKKKKMKKKELLEEITGNPWRISPSTPSVNVSLSLWGLCCRMRFQLNWQLILEHYPVGNFSANCFPNKFPWHLNALDFKSLTGSISQLIWFAIIRHTLFIMQYWNWNSRIILLIINDLFPCH